MLALARVGWRQICGSVHCLLLPSFPYKTAAEALPSIGVGTAPPCFGVALPTACRSIWRPCRLTMRRTAHA
jgi:hypothetical protein